MGSYTYGDTHHLHAATSVSGGYTATYDAAGDMQCRAPSSATTCSGAPTGQALTWDVEGRLANWQNTTTSPTVTAKYLYDGEGNRVVQQVVDSTAGTTTTTSYVGRLETYSITTGNQPTAITTTDYVSAGKVLAESVNGTLSYLATSYQGSVVEALDSTGNVGVITSQLYAPYGGVRYASGALPTDYGYTGQRRDASSGLDYYGAQATSGSAPDGGFRYYDPTLAQFASVNNSIAGPDPYTYSQSNPEEAGVDNGCPDWMKAVCAILTAISAGISYLHSIGVKEAQNLDNPSGTETTITTGSDDAGIRVKYSAEPDPIEFVDTDGNPVDPNERDDNNSIPPRGSTPRGSTPARGQVGKPQTASRNPGIIRGKSGSAGSRNHQYQATNQHDQIEMRRLEYQDRIQDTVSSTHPGNDPSWVQIVWWGAEGVSKPVLGVDLQQLWGGVQDWFNPSPSPSPSICGGVAKAGCIDPGDPFGKGDGDPDPGELPIELDP